jgi:hypothetical protein
MLLSLGVLFIGFVANAQRNDSSSGADFQLAGRGVLLDRRELLSRRFISAVP